MGYDREYASKGVCSIEELPLEMTSKIKTRGGLHVKSCALMGVGMEGRGNSMMVLPII